MPDHWARQRLLWRLRSVSPSERLLLLALNYHAGDSDEAWPSQATLAAEVGVSERHVRRLCDELEHRGWLLITRSWPNKYRIQWSQFPGSAEEKPDIHVRMSEMRKRTSETRKRTPMSARTGHPCPNNTQEHPNRTQCRNAASKKPSMPSIEPDDLRSPERLDALFRQAVAAGLVTDRDRLRWHTLARHIANRNGIRNPGGLMARLVRAGQWDGSDADEGKAQAAIKALDRQQAGPVNGHAQTLAASLRSDFRPRRDHDD